VEKVRRENDVWEVINKERKKRKRIEMNGRNEDIDRREWKEYFMRLLGGIEGKVVKGTGGEGREGKEEKRISREEVRRAIRKIKEGKACGIDGIPGEVWKFGGNEIENWVWEFSNRI